MDATKSRLIGSALNVQLLLGGVMKNNVFRMVAIGTTLACAVFAQNNQRQATMVGGGGPDRGKCIVEVAVDGVAQVEIRGTSGTLRTVSGQPAQWRRFECTGALPPNPASFRFSGLDGRGTQALIRDPRNGGTAIVQIEDRDGGVEGYGFEISWDSRGPNGGPSNVAPPNNPDRDQLYRDSAPGNRQDDRDRYRSEDQYRPNYRDSEYYRRYGHGFGVEEAIRVCQQEVVTQARRRFRANDIHFGRTAIDDNPGRNDWVTGTLDIHRGPRLERFGFSCSVNFDNGRVRSAELDARPLPDGRR